MADELLTKWLDFIDPLAMGQFANARANGLALTCGQFWVRTGGGYNLYRWTGNRLPVDPGSMVGAAGSGAVSVGNFPYIVHDNSTCYWYVLRAVGGGGVEEQNCSQVVRVALDDAGDLIGPQPNEPESVAARPLSGGRVGLGWRYNALGQEVAPAVFEIFGDGGTGVMDWDSPIGSVGYRRGKVDYEWTSEPFADGSRWQMAVRGKSEAGTSERNERTVVVWAAAAGPEPVPILVAELGAERR